MSSKSRYPQLVTVLRGLAVAAVFSGSWVAAACNDDAKDSEQPQPIVVGRAPAAAGGLPSVVMLHPLPASADTPPSSPAVMDQFGIAFIPRFLVARVGQPVEFHNSEDVDHNVRVVEATTDSMLFNVVTPAGDSYSHTFQTTGGYDVSCDIHPGMTAFVLVVTAPYTAVAQKDGSFSFTEIPPGSYTATVWSADSTRTVERRVEIRRERTELMLDRSGSRQLR